MTNPQVGTEAQARLLRARIVAEHWRTAMLGCAAPMQVAAHPLTMVLAALAGETDPASCGLSGLDGELFAKVSERDDAKPGQISDDEVLAIDVRRQFGEVTVIGTRMTADVLASSVLAGDHPARVADDYGVSVNAVLMACWWEVQKCHHAGRRTVREQQVLDRWGRWAEQAFRVLAGHEPGVCPHPPGPPDIA